VAKIYIILLSHCFHKCLSAKHSHFGALAKCPPGHCDHAPSTHVPGQSTHWIILPTHQSLLCLSSINESWERSKVDPEAEWQWKPLLCHLTTLFQLNRNHNPIKWTRRNGQSTTKPEQKSNTVLLTLLGILMVPCVGPYKTEAPYLIAIINALARRHKPFVFNWVALQKIISSEEIRNKLPSVNYSIESKRICNIPMYTLYTSLAANLSNELNWLGIIPRTWVVTLCKTLFNVTRCVSNDTVITD